MKKLLAAIIAVVVLVVGGTFVYINFIKEEAPERLSLTKVDPADDKDSTSDDSAGTAEDASVEGAWTVTEGSTAGYRVQEVLLGQSTTAAGRTKKVTGSLVISGTTLTETEIVVDIATITSDESRRDSKFRGDIMESDTYPNATFTLTEPVELGAIPAPGEQITATATGTLQLKAAEKTVTFEVQAQLIDGKIEVTGAIPVKFSDYGIDNPSNPVVTTEDNGEVEFLVVLARGD